MQHACWNANLQIHHADLESLSNTKIFSNIKLDAEYEFHMHIFITEPILGLNSEEIVNNT